MCKYPFPRNIYPRSIAIFGLNFLNQLLVNLIAILGSRLASAVKGITHGYSRRIPTRSPLQKAHNFHLFNGFMSPLE